MFSCLLLGTMPKQGKGRLHAGNDRLSDDDDIDEDALSGEDKY